MSEAMLEGSLRELALADVLQLLELGRRTGVLHVSDETRGRSAAVMLADGAVTGARLGMQDVESAAAIQRVVCALLDVRIGRFAFRPAGDGDELADAPRAGLRVEGILVEAARRADEWARLGDAVPHASVVPVLADAGDDAPLLLDARAWALLAEVDGIRDVESLADDVGRDPLELAGALAALARLGLVRCLDPTLITVSAVGATTIVPSAPGRSSTW